MKKILLSLMLVTAFTCEPVYDTISKSIYRCENDEVICYLYSGVKQGNITCKFKEVIDG
jgi:hypothetical protein